MALSDLQVFQEEAYTEMSEALQENVTLFNSATMGGLVLASAAHQGDFSTEAFWQRLDGLVRHRDPYLKNGAIPEKELSMGTRTSVKFASGTPELRMDAAWLTWLQKDPVEAGVIFGRQLAEQRLQAQVYTALSAFIAAIRTEGSNVYDHSAQTENGGKACLQAMLRAAAKMGDQASNVNCWVMHSKSVTDVYEQTLANAERLFSFGTVIVVTDAQGRPIIQTDAAPLFTTDITGDDVVPGDGGTADDRYFLCGLTSGAVVLESNSDFNQNMSTTNGNENIKSTYQAEWSEQLGVKGFTWDTANGGKNPDAAKLAIGTNWDKVVDSNKSLAGVLAIVK